MVEARVSAAALVSALEPSNRMPLWPRLCETRLNRTYNRGIASHRLPCFGVQSEADMAAMDEALASAEAVA